MIEYSQGNLLEANVEAIVNAVNCVGVMGKGIALQFKQAYPENFKVYLQACKIGSIRQGRVLVVPTDQIGRPKFIINFPTKRHWKGKSRIEDIESGLESLVGVIAEHQIRSIAIPALGCGNGGLEWKDVEPRIRSALSSLTETRVLLFAPPPHTLGR